MKKLINNKDTWIFDLDNTLYSAESGIFQQVHILMGEYKNMQNYNAFQVHFSLKHLINVYDYSF